MKKTTTTKKVLAKKQPGGPMTPGEKYNAIEKKYKSKYYTPDNVYKGDPDRKKQVDAMIKKQIKTEFDYTNRGGIAKGAVKGIKTSKKGGPIKSKKK